MKKDLYISKIKKIILYLIAWIISLLFVQSMFYSITKTEANNFSLSIKALLQNELNISNPQLASKLLLTLEQVGLTQCTKLEILEGESQIPFLDLTFKNNCENDYFSFSTFKVETKYKAANSTEWVVAYYKKSSESLRINLFSMRVLITLIFIFFLYFNFKEEKYRRALFEADLKNEKNKNKINAAIAQTTQMLAHDVRKPFTMIQSLLSLLEQRKLNIDDLIRTYRPEISKNLNAVNGMITDIMEVGSNTAFSTERIETSTLVNTALTNVFRYDSHTNISFEFELNHIHQLNINTLKVLRVFSNILNNASQAMKKNGRIWIRTNELINNGKEFIEFCIGNSDSFIEHKDLDQLFEAFYTKGKKNGTGLGLAIAKKIVNSHGGKIHCISSQELGVEFYFTLPIATDVEDTFKANLPRSTKDLIPNNPKVVVHESELNKVPKASPQFVNEEMLMEFIKNVAPLKVLVIDDESIYCHLIAGYVDENLAKLVNVHIKNNIHDVVQHVENLNPHLILLDVDLKSSIDGFEISKQCRQNGYQGKIYIHSNRDYFEYQPEFNDSGANLMIPKPMAKEQFFHILLSIAKSITTEKAASHKKPLGPLQ